MSPLFVFSCLVEMCVPKVCLQVNDSTVVEWELVGALWAKED